MLTLDLANSSDEVGASVLREALNTSASTDGYAARDLLASPAMSKAITSTQHLELQALVRVCGLSAGAIPRYLRLRLSDASDRAARALVHGQRDWSNEGKTAR